MRAGALWLPSFNCSASASTRRRFPRCDPRDRWPCAHSGREGRAVRPLCASGPNEASRHREARNLAAHEGTRALTALVPRRPEGGVVGVTRFSPVVTSMYRRAVAKILPVATALALLLVACTG